MKSILVVDDEYDIATTLELVLSVEGYHVATANNGREALDRIAHARPDIILMDVMMPIMTGLEAMAAIKSDPATASIPVILMSAALPKSSEVKVKWDGYITKPFDIDRLLNYLKSIIGSP